MKDKQQGAALVIVMALLSGALMIGISGMNSALIDERLAGNYRASVLAQMAAEKGASQLNRSRLDTSVGDCQSLVENYSTLIDEDDWKIDGVNGFDSNAYARYLTCVNSIGLDSLLVQGKVEGASAVSFIIRSFSGDSELPSFVVEAGIEDFFEWLLYELDGLNVEANCNAEEYSSGGVYYCDDGFSGDIGADFDGVTLIVSGNIDSRIENDVKNVTLIASGKITFRGVGQDKVTGLIWSGSDVTINGGGGQDFDISVCSPENATVNGGSLAQNQFCGWIEGFVVEELGYEGGGGSNDAGWTQL